MFAGTVNGILISGIIVDFLVSIGKSNDTLPINWVGWLKYEWLGVVGSIRTASLEIMIWLWKNCSGLL